MKKITFCIYFRLVDLICFRLFCYFPLYQKLLSKFIEITEKYSKINFVFYNRWGIGDALNDICYLQLLHQKRLKKNPIIFLDKSYAAVKDLNYVFPNVKIKKFPPNSIFAISLWQNQFRDVDKIKYEKHFFKCKNLKEDFLYKDAMKCSYIRLPKKINIINEISCSDLVMGFKYGSKTQETKYKSILICNSLPFSGQASIEDVKALENISLFFAKKDIKVYLTKKLEFIKNIDLNTKNIIELNYSLRDYITEKKKYSIIIGIATGPVWVALRENIPALLISRRDGFGKNFKETKSFKNFQFLKDSKEYKSLLKQI